jgi:hypothetical protein
MLVTLLILVAVNVVGYLVIYLLLKERVRRAASPAAQMEGLRDEVNRLVIELNQTTDRNIALIEDRIASLMELLGSADKKIGLMRKESEKHEVGARIYGRILAAKTPVPDAAPSSFAGFTERPPRAGESVPGSGPGIRAESIRDQVIALHNAGFSASVISARVGAPLGEVELIIALEERKRPL